jgi:hypothetical protein
MTWRSPTLTRSLFVDPPRPAGGGKKKEEEAAFVHASDQAGSPEDRSVYERDQRAARGTPASLRRRERGDHLSIVGSGARQTGHAS